MVFHQTIDHDNRIRTLCHNILFLGNSVAIYQLDIKKKAIAHANRWSR